MKKHKQDMLHGPLLPSILMYTIPIICTSILQLLFNAADLVVVGRFCGSVSVAAVGSTGAITNLIINLFIGLSVGAGVCVAQAFGSGDNSMIHRTVHTAIPAALVSGGLLTVVGVAFSDDFLHMMGTPDNVIKLSTLYMRIYFCGITFTMLYNFAASILRAVGDTKSPLIYLSLSGVVNVILNVIFVTVFHMNVAGVALATVISQGMSAILVLRALMRRDDASRLFLNQMRFYKSELLKIVRIGLPAGIQGSLFSISNVIIQSSVNSFGDIFMSGSAAASNLEGFVYVLFNSFHQTAVNFVGQNMGAGQLKRTRKVLHTCLYCATIAGLVAGSLVYLFADRLLAIYITDSVEAVSYGILRLGYIALPYFICGLMDVTTGALRGMGASITPMIISVVCVCGFRILWIYSIFQIPQYHTPQCLFVSYPISWLLSFALEMIAFVVIYKKKEKAMNELSCA